MGGGEEKLHQKVEIRDVEWRQGLDDHSQQGGWEKGEGRGTRRAA